MLDIEEFIENTMASKCNIAIETREIQGNYGRHFEEMHKF